MSVINQTGAALPDDEEQRLLALQQCHILDTAPEESFDCFTRVAAAVFDVPVALVTLVDAERQWFKSRQGLDLLETDRSASFCSHVIRSHEIMEVPDTLEDPRFRDNAMVTGPPHIRFYAGAPLVLECGSRIGTLCVIDRQPRRLDAQQRDILRDMAGAVSRQMISRRASLHEQTLSTLSRIMASSARKPRAALREALTLACEYLDMPFGVLSHVHDSQYTIHLQVSPPGTLQDGDVFPSENTLCEEVWRCGSVAAIPRGGDRVLHHGGWHGGGKVRMESYLGVPIKVGQYHGMLCFFSPEPCPPPGFSDSALRLVELMGQWAEGAMERWLLNRRVKANQRQLTRLSQVARQTVNGVVITGEDGYISWVNEGFTRISGYAADELIGRKPGRMLQGELTDRETVERIRQAIARREPFEEELRNYHRNGCPYWVHISCNPLQDADGRFEGFMAIQTDVTERKRLEEMKNEFISVVSHELRTPLTSIRGGLDLLLHRTGSKLDERDRKWLEMAVRNAGQLSRLVEDLLNLGRIASGRLALDIVPVALCPLLREAMDDHEAYARGCGVSLQLTPCGDARVLADAMRLRQVVGNLLSNACKFSARGSSVTVWVDVAPQQARIHVRDSGPGIAEEDRGRVFQRFVQLDASDTRRQRGTGLGLAICLELVQNMGGSIDFESRPGEGCVFHFDLPLAGEEGE